MVFAQILCLCREVVFDLVIRPRTCALLSPVCIVLVIHQEVLSDCPVILLGGFTGSFSIRGSIYSLPHPMV